MLWRGFQPHDYANGKRRHCAHAVRQWWHPDNAIRPRVEGDSSHASAAQAARDNQQLRHTLLHQLDAYHELLLENRPLAEPDRQALVVPVALWLELAKRQRYNRRFHGFG